MTNKEAIETLKYIKRIIEDTECDKALDLAIKALEKAKRYKSIWLEEHDAEPFCYKSILDTKTNDVYVCKGDVEHFKQYGMTIEKREEDAE